MIEHIECKAAISITDEGAIEVLAWPFGSADSVGDMIEPTAEIKVASPLPALWHHDPATPIGEWESVEITARGIEAKGRLHLDGERARAVRTLILDKGASGVSIGFNETKATRRNPRGRTITGLTLREISVTPTPCHPGAIVLTAKTLPTSSEKGTPLENETTEAAPDSAAITALESRLAAVEKKALSIDKIEARIARPAIVTETKEEPIERKAFETMIRYGDGRMDAEERKALVVANDAQGGYLAPEAIGSELLKKLVEYSPIRAYARVITIGAESIKYPRKTSSTAAYWVDETEDRTASQPAFEQINIKPHELATFTDVSNQLLEDNAYNLENELLTDFAENFGKTEGLAFVNGTGVGQPRGLLKAAGIAEIKTGVAAAFPAANPADVLIGMYHTLPTVHAQRAAWLMNRKTLGEVRKWKDGNGRYLVIDPISEGAPMTLLGRPIVEAVDMDDIVANGFPVMFGDLQGYRIVDRVGFATLRDPYSLATKGQTRFIARKRVGADVTHPDRFVKLKIAA
ncbi:phage major capsid protein [Fulvimarina sp. 2208YS6-2-32]|uniref:Phage major capsid protein n=1 Tax=Fulvimarina uroteuthidis TaxID=3098149 RepID=A0ABU5HX95_9HYPH|nr:phage major capsid protein [Fulvimarina sp. 2208YS6-2-32]MDY8107758.1 phage major capsid protein [Fulvimarina sp. 2208YS6-2-32]